VLSTATSEAGCKAFRSMADGFWLLEVGETKLRVEAPRSPRAKARRRRPR
jgi:hypothetical protein